MNIPVFLKSLNKDEITELRNHLAIKQDDLFPFKSCANFANETKTMSSRLANILREHPQRNVFDFLNGREFYKLRGAGKQSYFELMKHLLPYYN